MQLELQIIKLVSFCSLINYLNRLKFKMVLLLFLYASRVLLVKKIVVNPQAESLIRSYFKLMVNERYSYLETFK